MATVPITYYKSTRLERALARLFVEVDKAYKDGANILILSDRGVDENHVAHSLSSGCVRGPSAPGGH